MGGTDANGAAPTKGPLFLAGFDGTNVRAVKTDNTGILQVNLSGLAVACAGLPALTGDVTSSGCAVTIANNAVTQAKVLNGFVDLSTAQSAIAGVKKFTSETYSPAFNSTTRGDRQPILQNPDFEGSSTIPPPGWIYASGPQPTVTYETTSPAPSKLQSIKLSTSTAFVGIQTAQTFSVIPGETYSITAAMKSDGTGLAVAEVVVLDKSGGFLAGFDVTTSSTSWNTQTKTFTIPASGVQANVTLSNGVATLSSIWFDQIHFQKTSFQSINNIQTINNTTTGADICAKITTAITALGSAGGTIDARFFTGTQACATNPFAGILGAGNAAIRLLLGSVQIQINTAGAIWVLQGESLAIEGDGPMNTAITYTGTGAAAYVVGLDASSASVNGGAGLFGNTLKGVFIDGNTHTTNALVILNEFHVVLDNVSAWGATGAAVYSNCSFTNSFRNLRVSSLDVTNSGWPNTQVPSIGFEADSATCNGTTKQISNTSCQDCAFEGITTGVGTGVWLKSGNMFAFLAGTSENNVLGVQIDSASKNNTFINFDMESNTGNTDLLDNGTSNTCINCISTSSTGISLGATSANFCIMGGQSLITKITLNASATPGCTFSATTRNVVKGSYLNLMVTGANFVTAANTNLQTITGLSFTFPANQALNASLDCDLAYSQQTAAVADAFGFQDATVAPTNLEATGFVQTAATTWAEGNVTASSTTTATNVIAFTPSAITTVWHAHLHFGLEQPSNASTSLFSVMVKTGTAADTVTVFRGSHCHVMFQ